MGCRVENLVLQGVVSKIPTVYLTIHSKCSKHFFLSVLKLNIGHQGWNS